jgi:hypothetical protein
MPTKFQLPDFLKGRVEQAQYSKWLQAKARTHRGRDKRRGNHKATNAAHKLAIHNAIVGSGGVDEYTGEELHWHLIGTWKNAEAKEGGRKHKERYHFQPTIDHVGDGMSEPNFKICSYRTNDAKGVMSYEEFITFCQLVVAHSERPRSAK